MMVLIIGLRMEFELFSIIISMNRMDCMKLKVFGVMKVESGVKRLLVRLVSVVESVKVMVLMISGFRLMDLVVVLLLCIVCMVVF